MKTKYDIICFITAVHFINAHDGLTAPTTRAEVESKLICTAKWQKLQLNWKSTDTKLSLKQNFSSFWAENQKDLKTQTVNRLLEAVIYPHNFTKDFSCYGTIATYAGSVATWVNNVSFNVTLPKVGSELLGVRLISKQRYERRLEFYLRSTSNIDDVSYNLSYCMYRAHPGQFEKDYTCPVFRSVPFRCLLRDSDVYGIPNSAGFICQAWTIDYVNIYTKYKFHIRSIARDGSNSVSADFRIYTKESVDEPISLYAYQGYFTVVLMGRKSGYLIATITEEQRVALKWEQTTSDTYQVNYSCSNGANSSESHKQASITIYNKNFAPYTLCQFCVTNQVSAGGLWSEPACNTTRFPEKSPSKPPRITCDFKTCPTTSYPNKTQAVTVKCELPKKNTRNGLLNKMEIFYWKDNSSDVLQQDSFNLTSCELILTGLSKMHYYFAQMSVCNSKGCSSLSDIVPIAAAVHPSTGNPSGTQLYWLMLLAVLPIAATIIGISVYCYRRTTRPEPPTSLPNLEEPNNYEHLQGSMGHQLSNYHELPNGDTNDNVIDKIVVSS